MLAAATRILLYSVLHTVLEVLYILYSILIVLPIDTAAIDLLVNLHDCK